jgi:hypothetical protein
MSQSDSQEEISVEKYRRIITDKSEISSFWLLA